MHTHRLGSTVDSHTSRMPSVEIVHGWKVWQTQSQAPPELPGKASDERKDAATPGLVKLGGRRERGERERTWFFSLTAWFLKPQFPPGWSQSTLARSKQPMHNSKILFPSKGSCFEILNFELLHTKKKERRGGGGGKTKYLCRRGRQQPVRA